MASMSRDNGDGTPVLGIQLRCDKLAKVAFGDGIHAQFHSVFLARPPKPT